MSNIYAIAIPACADTLSLAAVRKLKEADCIILKQSASAMEAYLQEQQLMYRSLDYLWDSCADYDELHQKIADLILNEARDKALVYLLPEPLFDISLKLLSAQTQITVVPSLSLTQSYLCTLDTSSIDNITCISASSLLEKRVHPKQSLLITELGDALLAGQVKLKLGDLFDEEMSVCCLTLSEGKIKQKQILLYELDRQNIDHNSALFVQGQGFLQRKRFDFEDLQDIIAMLRGPEGCPWDKKQTHESLREYMIEEAHELVGAIYEKDMDNICEELGDVLLQVVLHASIAEQSEEFNANDITSQICQKMIARHAHIFGDKVCNTAEDVVKSWEEIKRKEKGLDSVSETMLGISKHLPSLMRAEKVQSKAAKAGMDFASAEAAAGKINEELAEVLAELSADRREKLEEEIGDLLFSVVNVARLAGCSSDVALSISTEKFIRRFKNLEKMLNLEKKALKDLTLEEIDVYWNIGKAVLED